MAKISAHGATKVAQATLRRTLESGTTFDIVLVLTSDGRLLRRDRNLGGGYTVIGRLKDGKAADAATLARIIERRFSDCEVLGITR